MVLTITFNPAVDKSVSVSALMPDKKMQCSDQLYEPGGGGINVARVIRRLGGEVTALFPSGGYNGRLLQMLLKVEGVDYIPVLIENSNRENLVVLDRHTNLQYRFGMPGPHIATNECQHLLDAVERRNDLSFIVASGSLPPGVPPDILARLSIIAKKKNIRLVVDTTGEAMRLALKQGVYLIKPNLSELEAISGSKDLKIKDVELIGREMIAKDECEVVVVSMGASGCMLITDELCEIISAPAVKKRSTVGAGDSMLGGIIYSLTKGDDIRKAVRLGIACGSAATLAPATGLCNVNDVYQLLEWMDRKQFASA